VRIPDSSIASSLIRQLSQASARLFRLQEQVASGLAFKFPSQNPPAAMRAASLRSGIAELARYRQNCGDAERLVEMTEITLREMADSLREARSAAVAMSPFDPDGNSALADQVDEIARRIVAGANLTSEGRYLLAGHELLTPPVVENPPGIPPYLYQGDRGDIPFQLSRGLSLVANLDAAEVLNFDGASDPARDDTLETLRQLAVALRAGDGDAVAAGMDAIDWHLDRVVSLRAQIGARLQHVQLAHTQLETGILLLREQLSEVQHVDITKAVIELRSQEIAYQAAAAAAGAIHRASLLEYF